LLKVPAMIFEPNAMPGLANRLVGKRVQAAAINFSTAAKWFRDPEVTGIPVRPEFFELRPPANASPHLLVFGGSQGAQILNIHVPALIAELLAAVPGLTVTHQSGIRQIASTQAAYAKSGADPARWQVRPFIEDMPAVFAQAHLVLSRSGASTVAELAAAGKPALLIPFAAATDDHQRRNAEAMVEAGAAVMMLEKEVNDAENGREKLLQTLVGLLTRPDKLAAMGKAARTQAHPDAAERIAARLAELARK
jgi:UDP-N-acetylglucosamine--N-acetylmuramyl-(pentapeptide) pyrophosphoryl-undecaprenol N-acetylglucosamine transferase